MTIAAAGSPPVLASSSAGVAASRTGYFGALVAALGVVLSGPLSLVVLGATHPQPEWQGADVFVQHYHPAQAAPFFAGMLLVGGFVVVAALHAGSPAEHRARTSAALVFAGAYAALVFFNYAVQTTFVPSLAREDAIGVGPLLSALSMANPTSLAWGLEMWGYALLGVATWLVAPTFGSSALERWAGFTFFLNGPVSVVTAVATAARPGWPMTSVGLAAFAAWNVLALAMAVLAALALRTRTHA